MALNPTLSSQTLNCSFTNTTDSNKELVFDVKRQENILASNPSSYDVYVSRFYIDSAAIPSFRITETIKNDYYVGVMYKNFNTNFIRTMLLPVKDFYAEKDFIDSINQNLERAYYNMLQNMVVDSSHILTKLFASGDPSILFNSTSYATLTTSAVPGDFSLTNSVNYLSVFINVISLTTSSNLTGVTFSLYIKNLISNVEVLVSNKITTDCKNIWFSDFGALSQDQMFNAGSSSFTGQNNTFRPLEMLNIYKGTQAAGPWAAKLVPNATIGGSSFNLTAGVSLYYGCSNPIISAFPTSNPYFIVDDSTKKIGIKYTDAWKLSGVQIVLSPKLYAMMGFDAELLTASQRSVPPYINSLDGDVQTYPFMGYILSLPDIGYNWTNMQTTWRTFYQSISTYETLCDIESIDLITSMNIELQQDLLADRGGQKVLTNFLISEYSGTSYQYIMTGDNKRRFRMNQVGELTSFQLRFVVRRKDQINFSTFETVQLAPGMFSNILLIFEPL